MPNHHQHSAWLLLNPQCLWPTCGPCAPQSMSMSWILLTWIYHTNDNGDDSHVAILLGGGRSALNSTRNGKGRPSGSPREKKTTLLSEGQPLLSGRSCKASWSCFFFSYSVFFFCFSLNPLKMSKKSIKAVCKRRKWASTILSKHQKSRRSARSRDSNLDIYIFEIYTTVNTFFNNSFHLLSISISSISFHLLSIYAIYLYTIF